MELNRLSSAVMGLALATLLQAGPWGLAPARAAPPPGAGSAALGYVDLNGDTRISYEEFVQSLALKAMTGLGADGAAPRVAPAASAPAGNGTPGPLDLTLHFSLIDTDRNGLASLDEMKRAIGRSEAARALFKRLDKNGDGFLDPSELEGQRVLPEFDIQF